MSYKISKILVPIDLSETSLNAFRTASHVALKHAAGVIIINVNEKIFEINKRQQLHSPHYANPDVLSALIATLKQNKIDAKLIQANGTVPESIIKTALEEKIDLIIMGTHGASGMREGYMGSNAYNVVKHATCPVLTMPGKVRLQSFSKVLWPILPIADAFASYDIVCKFLDAGSIMEVLGLSSLKFERKTKILDDLVDKVKIKLEKEKVRVETSWANGGTVSEEILSNAQMILPDLIVLTSMIDAIYRPDFTGPHTQKILNSSRVPLLCIK